MWIRLWIDALWLSYWWNKVNRIHANYLWCLLSQKKHSRVDVNNLRYNIDSIPSFAKRAKGLKESTGKSASGWKDRVHPQFCMVGTMHHVVSAVCVWSLRKFYIKFMLWRIQIVIYVEICDLNHLSENFPLGNLYVGVWSNSMLCVIPNNQNSIKIIYVLNIS